MPVELGQNELDYKDQGENLETCIYLAQYHESDEESEEENKNKTKLSLVESSTTAVIYTI